MGMYKDNESGTDMGYYVHTDYLGSVIALSDNYGFLVEEYAYDAWGKRRGPNDWSYFDGREEFICDRGFTGHEHLQEFDLINMNGRVYDQALGMFLSPDPVLQSPGNALNYNRYSYCFNNPLRYTDPSGYKISPKDYSFWVSPFANRWFSHSGGGGGNSMPTMGNNGNWSEGDLNTAWDNYYGVYDNNILNTNPDYYGTGESYTGKAARQEFIKRHEVVDSYRIIDWVNLHVDIRYIYQFTASSDGVAVSDNTNIQMPMYMSGGNEENNNSGSSLNWTDGIGPGLVAIGSGLIHKNSAFAKMIFPRSMVVGNASKFTSLFSLTAHGTSYRLGASFIGGATTKAVPVIGWFWTYGELLYHGSQENTRQLQNHGIDPYNYGRILNDFKCFAAGTKVTMGDMTYKNIENIVVGDSVLTYNFKTKKLEVNIVQQIEDPIHHKLIKIAFRNGENIISTDDHPYYVEGKGWCSFNPEKTQKAYGLKTKKLEVSDFCFTIKGSKLRKVRVIEIMQYEESIRTYNLSKISNSNNYFVNGILVHNESK